VTPAIRSWLISAVLLFFCLQLHSAIAQPGGDPGAELASLRHKHKSLADTVAQWIQQEAGQQLPAGSPERPEATGDRLVLLHPVTHVVIPLPSRPGTEAGRTTNSGHLSPPVAELSDMLKKQFPQLMEGWLYAFVNATGDITRLSSPLAGLGSDPAGQDPKSDTSTPPGIQLPAQNLEVPVLLDISQAPDQPLTVLGAFEYGAANEAIVWLDAGLVQKLQSLPRPLRDNLVLATGMEQSGRLRLSRILLPLSSLILEPKFISDKGRLAVNANWPAHQCVVRAADLGERAADLGESIANAQISLPDWKADPGSARSADSLPGIELNLSFRTQDDHWHDYPVASLPDPTPAQDSQRSLPLKYLLMLMTSPSLFDGSLSLIRQNKTGKSPQVLFRLSLKTVALSALGQDPVLLADLLSDPSAIYRHTFSAFQTPWPDVNTLAPDKPSASNRRGKERARTGGAPPPSAVVSLAQEMVALAEEMKAWLENDARFVLPHAQHAGVRLSLAHLPTETVLPVSLSTVQFTGAPGEERFRAVLPCSGEGLDALVAEFPTIKSNWLYALTNAHNHIVQLLPTPDTPLRKHRSWHSLPGGHEGLDLHRLTPKEGVEFPCIGDITQRATCGTALNTGSAGSELLTHIPVSVLRQIQTLDETLRNRLALVSATRGPQGYQMTRLVLPVSTLIDADILDTLEASEKSSLSLSLAWPLTLSAITQQGQPKSGTSTSAWNLLSSSDDDQYRYELAVSVEDAPEKPLYLRVAALPPPVDWSSPMGKRMIPGGRLEFSLRYLLSLASSPLLRHGKLYVVSRHPQEDQVRANPLHPERSLLELAYYVLGQDRAALDYWLAHAWAATTATALEGMRVSCQLPPVDENGRLLPEQAVKNPSQIPSKPESGKHESSARPAIEMALPTGPLPPAQIERERIAGQRHTETTSRAAIEPAQQADNKQPALNLAELAAARRAREHARVSQKRQPPAPGNAPFPSPSPQAQREPHSDDNLSHNPTSHNPTSHSPTPDAPPSPSQPITPAEREGLMRYLDTQPVEQAARWLWQGLSARPSYTLGSCLLLYAAINGYQKWSAPAESEKSALIRKALTTMGSSATDFQKTALRKLVFGTPDEALRLWTPENLAWWTLYSCQSWCKQQDCQDDRVPDTFLHYVLAPVSAAEPAFRKELELRFSRAVGNKTQETDSGHKDPWRRVVERRCQGLPTALDYDPVTRHWWMAELDAGGLLVKAHDQGSQRHIPVKVLRRSFIETELTEELHERFKETCGQGRLTDATNQYRPVFPYPLGQQRRAAYTCASLDGDSWRALDRTEGGPGLYGVPALLGHAQAVDDIGQCVTDTLEPELTVLYGDGSGMTLTPALSFNIPVQLSLKEAFTQVSPDNTQAQVQFWKDRSWQDLPVATDGAPGTLGLVLPHHTLYRVKYEGQTVLFTLDRFASRLELWSWPAPQPQSPSAS